ncbi:MAG: cysteine--tRNA ligase [Anaerolineales bacterium]|jgi:cysteinyl-tRNA synthetase
MGLMIYNTMTRTKEPFETLEEGKVRMYVCGPTVYDKAHVGHAMSSLVFDIIRRYLEFRGFNVLHVMNYTDVDDKIIDKANQIKANPVELAMGYIRDYDRHMHDLNVLDADIKPRVSEEIKPIIEMVSGLIEKGYAYELDGDVYFRVEQDKDYGKLSRRKLEDMRAGYKIGVDERKEDPADFALWKSAKPGEPSWESPWGPGRPGWHIECSVMSLHHLGEQIDIHGGGNDLVFPHHENEIAQTESYTGKPFARYWVHNGMMQFGGEKMSKSVGNLVTIESFLDHNDPDVLRMMILNSSYRNPLTFTQEVIDQAEAALERLRGALKPARPQETAPHEAADTLAALSEHTRQAFIEAMDDDFNTAGALGHLFDLVRGINQARDAGVDEAALSVGQSALLELTEVLGLRLAREGGLDQEAAPFIDLLIDIRRQLREAKQYELSDMIRDRLEDLGVSLEDTPQGTIWSAG